MDRFSETASLLALRESAMDLLRWIASEAPRGRTTAYLTCALALGAIGLMPSGASADRRGRQDIPRVIISTDVALGLNDTHGGQSLSPISFSEPLPSSGGDPTKTPQDIDDGLTLAMAINLDRVRALDLLAVVPIFGNASLQPEMLVAHQIIRTLKRAYGIPIVAGAHAPSGQVLHANPTWFDGATVPILGRRGSFAASCTNPGVRKMRRDLARSRQKVTLLALGPATDIACLLTTTRRSTMRKIDEIIWLASQLEGESLLINGKVANDFNFRLDPLAGTIMLAAAAQHGIPIRLMSFSLTGQTSQSHSLIAFDAASFTGPAKPTPRSKRSLAWLLAASAPRNAFWADIFGTPEGPFDQYALAAAVWPELFECRPARAYIVQCPHPAWSSSFDPTSEVPYNTAENPCVDHPSGGLAQVTAQLIVSLDQNEDGPLIRGQTGVDGNLPSISSPAVEVEACIDFAPERERSLRQFRERLEAYTW